MRTNQKIALFFLIAAGVVVTLLSSFLTTPVKAQIFYYTPTASENGNIYYIVKENETCNSIAAINNVDVAVLRELNSLDLDQCRFLQVGQQLLLGTVPTPVITSGPSPTPTSDLPTPEPVKGFGAICVYLYDDVNGNAIAEDSEITNTGLAGGEISITDKAGVYSKIGTTLNTGEPVCFEEAPEGEYTVSIAIPNNYNPTSGQNYTINLKAGDTATINFSAQASSSLPGVTKEANSSVFLAVIGGLILVVGVGLGVYARVMHKK